MEFIKKTAGAIFIILFIASIFNDLTVGTMEKTTEESAPEPLGTEIESRSPVQESHKSGRFSVKSVEIQAGDTVLSITEEINATRAMPSINQIIADFLALNPETEPNEIKPLETYLFPVYPTLD